MRARIVLLGAILASATACAQQRPRSAAEIFGPEYVTPEVHGDDTVTFRLTAPEAAGVELRFGTRDYPMKKDGSGVWSATVGPVDPDFYAYSFEIGGARVNSGLVDVPSSPPRYDEWQDVPHGSINLHTYFSQIQGRPRSLRVYVPPQYYSEPNRRFPVLYLFSALDEAGWTSEGRANIILDNLIAGKKAAPMILVMPNSTIHGEDLAAFRAGHASNMDTVAVMEKEVPNEIIPLIEKEYRVLPGRENRAIAGLSFGGGTTFGVGMRHLELFDYVGLFSAGTFGGAATPPPGMETYLLPYDPEKIAPGIYKNLMAPATKLKLFYMACGDQDPRLPFQRQAYEDFEKHGIQPLFVTFPGGHEFKFFRRAMADFATKLFR